MRDVDNRALRAQRAQTRISGGVKTLPVPPTVTEVDITGALPSPLPTDADEYLKLHRMIRYRADRCHRLLEEVRKGT